MGKIAYKAVGVVIGLVFTGYGISERSATARIKSGGETAIVDPIKGYTKHSQSGSATYTAEFTFKTQSGREMIVKKSFPEEILKDFEANVPVKVYYDPRNPYEFVFEKEGSSWFLIGIGVAIALAAILFF